MYDLQKLTYHIGSSEAFKADIDLTLTAALAAHHASMNTEKNHHEI